jgi:hypothetical protein
MSLLTECGHIPIMPFLRTWPAQMVSVGPAPVANLLCRGQEKHRMRETKVQTENSGLKCYSVRAKRTGDAHEQENHTSHQQDVG